MPQNRSVYYPPVNRPTAQGDWGLAPPRAEQNRFSWQNSSTDLTAPTRDAEQHPATEDVGNTHNGTQSGMPALPILPDHLHGQEKPYSKHQEATQSQAAYLQDNHSFIHSQVPYPEQDQFAQQQQQHFRPNDSKYLHEQQYPSQYQQPEPPVSYEASQAVHYPVNYPHSKMQERPMYPGHHDTSHMQLSAHAFPMHNTRQTAASDEYQSQDHKPTQTQAQDDASREDISHPKPRVPAPIHVGPDANPLSPDIMPPTHYTNMQSVPPPSTSAEQSEFPQVANFVQPAASRGGSWQHGLGSCAEPTTCLSSMFCPCVVYGKTQYRLSLKSAKKDPTNMLGYSTVNGSCIAWSVLCGVNILLTAIQHTRIRKAYEMEGNAGNVAGDCLKSICCCCCIIAQDEKEVRLREEGCRKGEGAMDKGYKSPRGMTFSPPPR